MHVVGDVLICGLVNISYNILVVQGISIPTGEELWQFYVPSLPYYVDMRDVHVLVPNQNVVFLCGSLEQRLGKEDELGYRLAFLTFHPELFEPVPEDN